MVLAQQTYNLTKQKLTNKEIQETITKNEGELEQAKQNATNAVQKADELTQQVTELDVNISAINNHLRSPNIIQNPEPMFTLVDYPKTQDSVSDGDWQKMDNRVNNKEILPKNITTFSAESKTKYTQQIEIMTDGTLDSLTFSFYTTYGGHRPVQAELITLSEGCYIAYASWTATETTDVRVCDIKNIIFTGSYIKFRHPKIEEGEYTPYYVEAKNTVEAIKKVEETTNGFISEVSDMTFFHKENLIGTLEPMPTLNAYPSSVVSVDDNGWAKFSNTLQEQEVLPISAIMISVEAEQKYTQQITIETDGNLEELTFTFYCNNSHNKIPSNIIKQSDNRYIAYSSWTPSSSGSLRCVDIKSLTIEGGSYVKFCHPKVEKGDYTAYTLSDAMNNATAQISKIEQTQDVIKTTVQDNTGKISQVTQTVEGLNSKVQTNTGNISSVTQTVKGIQSTVKDNKNNISQLTQTSQSLQSSISDLTHSTNSKISQLSDNINAKVSKGDLVAQINLDPSGVLIDGKKVQITGETYIQNGVIKDAMIGSLNVEKLNGDLGNFYKLLFEDGNANMKLASDGIRFSALDKGNTWDNEYLEVNSGHLKWWSDGDHGQQYAYLGTAKRNRSMNITLGVVNNSNADNDYPTLALRSAGQNTFLTSRNSSIVSGSFVYVGNNTANYESSSLYDSFTSASTDGNILSNTTSKVVIGAQNGVFFRPGTAKNDSVYFCKDYSWDSNSGIEFTRTDNKGMMIRAKGIYNNTGGDSPNLFIRSSGYIYRSTSARKYKEDIEYMHNLEQAKQLLNIDPASWIDKAEKEAFREGKERTLPRRVGFIADDFYRLGLTDVVVKDEKGEIEGLAYDKISIYIIPLLKDLYYKLGVLEKELKEK